MSRIASVKETGEEISQTDWTRFERAVRTEVEERDRDRLQPRAKDQPEGPQLASTRGKDQR